MKSVILVCFFLNCFVNSSEGTFRDFLKEMPSDIAHAFDVAWISLSDAIKKPVRMRRMGPLAKRRTMRHTKFLTSSTPTNKITLFTRTTETSGIKVTLPFLPTPLFRSLDEWLMMQKPGFATSMKPSTEPESISYAAPTANYQKRRLSDEDNFGPLMFI